MKFSRDILHVLKKLLLVSFNLVHRMIPGLAYLRGLPTGLIWDFPTWVEKNDRRMPWLRRGWLHSFQTIYPPELVQSPFPNPVGDSIRHMYVESEFYQFPRLGVGFLRWGRIATRFGVVMDPDGKVIEDFNYYWNRSPHKMPIFDRFHLPKKVRKEGLYATILSPDATPPNYYHWMAEALPRLALLEESGIRDYRLILPDRMTGWQCEILRLLGLDENRWAPFGEEQWQVEHLLVPSLQGYPGMSHPRLVRWLRERLGVEGSSVGHRKLYLSRTHAQHRRLLNEEKVIQALKPLGFETVFPEEMTVSDQLRMFRDASWIVALHGAGLTNTLFAPRGTRVLEFVTPDPAYLSTSFYSICCALGHIYGNICVQYPGPRLSSSSGLRWREDVEASVDDICAAIHTLSNRSG
jgi:hypothetical protein